MHNLGLQEKKMTEQLFFFLYLFLGDVFWTDSACKSPAFPSDGYGTQGADLK